MDALTAKLRARDRAERARDVQSARFFASRVRLTRMAGWKEAEKQYLSVLVHFAGFLHARRGTLDLPSTQRAIARFVLWPLASDSGKARVRTTLGASTEAERVKP